MSRSTFFIFLLLLAVAIEVYTFIGLKSAFREGTALKIARWVHLTGVLISLSTIAVTFITMRQGLNAPGLIRNWLMGLMVTFFVTKLTFALVLGLDDIVRVIQYFIGQGSSLVSGNRPGSMPGRRRFIAQAGLIVAAVPFASFLYGIVKGKYAYTVHRVKIAFDSLPEAFNGFRIVQISDIHAGSFDDKEAVAAGVRMAAEEKGDVIIFTGDLVNNFASEIEPYLDLFGGLNAPFGKFSVMGNHDYGHYVPWESKAAEHENVAKIRAHHAQMGFRLLQNEHAVLEKDGQRIRIAGVENWGLPPFPQYGDLDKALAGIDPGEFTVLLSHDPTHWDEQVKGHSHPVDLTLSGHTHGFQMGIEIPGIKWSPVQFRYKKWAGLYADAGKHLYVNRGFGFLGFPGRVGIWPEITVIELVKA